LDQGSADDRIDLVRTPNYIPPQTAFHATWLLFGEEAVAAEFLELHPQHQLDSRLAKIGQTVRLTAEANTASSAATST
jgi:hypothetical protein